ncbi:hypothetical protein MBOE_09480 [Mycolicibacterium boenickei]|uniref:Uncharacterized protein n=1 Tax=Mycolicibacterium boenickei TaxID=146017 RepID=A0ABN5Z8D4_9MYCO|nr:hypothetical protein MBOE_09480 [Mycolicibacterium boenickei]
MLCARGVAALPLVVLTDVEQHDGPFERGGYRSDIYLPDFHIVHASNARMPTVPDAPDPDGSPRRLATGSYPQFPQVHPQPGTSAEGSEVGVTVR